MAKLVKMAKMAITEWPNKFLVKNINGPVGQIPTIFLVKTFFFSKMVLQKKNRGHEIGFYQYLSIYTLSVFLGDGWCISNNFVKHNQDEWLGCGCVRVLTINR